MTAATSTLLNLYFACFLTGFGLAVLAFVLGAIDLHAHGGHAASPHGGLPGHEPAGGHHPEGATGPGRVSVINLGTAATFSMWLGASGYLLTHDGELSAGFVLLCAGLLGIVGAAIVFAFVTRVLMRTEQPLVASDYDMKGLVATVTAPIRAGGIGEIAFSQMGTRRSASARSSESRTLGVGAEVVVVSYEEGLADVRLLEGVPPDLSGGL